MAALRTLIVGMLLAATSAAAANAELDRAEQLFDQLKYADAATALQRALAVRGNDRATLLRIYELQGIVDAAMGRKTALTHFRRLLALDPERSLSRDNGPRILGPFYEAKARLGEFPPLRLEVRSTPAERQQRLTVIVQSDSLSLARAVRIHWRVANGAWSTKSADATAGAAAEVVVEAERADWWVELVGANDALLMEEGSPTRPLVAQPPAPKLAAPLPAGSPAVGHSTPSPLPGRRKASVGVAAAGLVTLGGFVGFGLYSRSARDQLENPQRDGSGAPIGLTQDGGSRARALEAQAVNSAIIANAMLGATVACAGVASILWFSEKGPEARVTLAPSGAGLVVSGTLP